MDSFVELIRALAWPALVAGVLFAFFEPLNKFVGDLGNRVNKLSLFGIELELGLRPLIGAPIDNLNFEVEQMREGGSSPSSPKALLYQLEDQTPLDYAVIDIKAKGGWLISRLFLFAALLSERRGLRAFVFVDSSGTGKRRFLGTATPTAIQLSFRQKFPWLERAFIEAYEYVLGISERRSVSLSALDISALTELTDGFLRRIQSRDGLPPSYGTELRNGVWEHTEWILPEKIEEQLSGILHHEFVQSWRTYKPQQLTREILNRSGRFIALLNSQGEFEALVDRLQVLESFVKQASRDA